MRYAFIQQCEDYSLEKYGRTVFEMSLADLAKIRRLRETHAWREIADTMYPVTSPEQLRLAFRGRISSHKETGHGMSEMAADTASNRQSNGRGRTGPGPFRIPLADIAEVRRLREMKTTWTAIAAQMYPTKTNREALRKAYVEQMGTSAQAQRASNFDISSADMSDIQRLRQRGRRRIRSQI